MSDALFLIESVRMMLTGRLERVDVELFLFLENLQRLGFGLGHLVHDLLQLERVLGAVVLLDRLADGDLAGHHGLDVVPGHELDVVHGEDVRRVRHADGQRGAGAVDRQDEVLLRHLGGNEVDHRLVDLEVPQVDRRHAVLLGQELGDVVFLDVTQLDQVEPDLFAVVSLRLEGFVELVLSDQTRADQHLPQLDGHELPRNPVPPRGWVPATRAGRIRLGR
jgi:hypothetical protein